MPLPLRYNWRSLVRRKARTALTVAGIGLAVLVALLMLALARGITSGIQNTGHPLNVLVTSKGSETIEFSALERRTEAPLRYSPHVAKLDGEVLVSPEVFFASNFAPPNGASSAQALLRGVTPVAMGVHDQVKIVEGRFPQADGEIMVGPLVAKKLGVRDSELLPGKELTLDGKVWKIVGHFQAPGTVYESEIWGLLDAFLLAGRRTELNAVVLRAMHEEALDELLFDLDFRTDILVASQRQIDYYAAYAATFQPVARMIQGMAVLLVAGGALVGMNTLYASMVGRIREIGMLRTIGYGRWDVALAFVMEGLLPAWMGGALACLLAWTFHGFALRIPMGAFQLQMDAVLFLQGMLLATIMGLVGSIFPVWRAVRLRTIEAIHHL